MLINERFVRHGVAVRSTAARGVRELRDASRPNEAGMLMSAREQAEFADFLATLDVVEAHRC